MDVKLVIFFVNSGYTGEDYAYGTPPLHKFLVVRNSEYRLAYPEEM
jgi:hypothetical protein